MSKGLLCPRWRDTVLCRWIREFYEQLSIAHPLLYFYAIPAVFLVVAVATVWCIGRLRETDPSDRQPLTVVTVFLVLMLFGMLSQARFYLDPVLHSTPAAYPR